jgi:hypothetical protein
MIFQYEAQRFLLKVRGTNFTPATNWYVALSSTTPNNDGTGITEPSGGNYARSDTTADQADWIAGSTVNIIENGVTVPYATTSADWLAGAPLTWFVIYDAVSAGNALYAGPLSTPKIVLSGTTPSFAPGAMVIPVT